MKKRNFEKISLITVSFFIIAILALIFSCYVDEGGPTPGSYSISGTVICNDAGLHNVGIILIGDSEQETTTNSEGYYEITIESPGFYTIQPEKEGFAFAPSTYSVLVEDEDIANRDFVASAMVGYRVDKWGYVWDEAARTAMTWQQAKDICESVGGRLPTPTEIYRNRATTGTSEIATSQDTQYLWTFIENSQNNYVCVRLSDGTVTNYGAATARSFRCVWPDKTHDYFTGSYVTTLPTEDDFTFTINGTEYIMDTYDRVALTYNEAVREATFYHAFIPSEGMYTAAIRAGLPNGSNAWCFTSDHVGYNGSNNYCVGVVRWTGVATEFNDRYSTYSSRSAITTRRSFRCIGVHMPVEPHPQAIVNEWVDSHTKLKSTSLDEGYFSFIDAIDFCFESGGHLPTYQDLMILIQAGLPGGSNTWLWNGEYHDGNYVGLIRWPGVCPYFTGYISTYMARSNPNSGTRVFRSVYYPINTSYNGPDPSICQGGRFEISQDIGDGNYVKMWCDNEDRPPATFAEALSICHDLGGHLASHRDMVELIRNGLPNGMDQSEGANIWLWTSDRANHINEVEVVKWQGTGTKSTFQDIYGTTVNDDCSDGSNGATTARPFRCVWTNEIRVF